jgi:hypothetical protein
MSKICISKAPAFHLVPEGGLGNRMRAIASAYALSRRVGIPLNIEWYRTFDMNIGAHRVFELHAPGTEISDHYGAWPLGPMIIRGREAMRRTAGWNVLVQRNYPSETSCLDIEDRLKAPHCRLHLRTCYQIDRGADIFKIFTPAEQVLEFIAPLSAMLPSSIGVHIRRTDNVAAMQRSSLDNFIAKMDAEEPNATFFVATDDASVLGLVERRYTGRVFCHPKRAYERSNPDAILDAAVDLFCLSMCRKLIGSYSSSFTDTAQALRNVEHVIVGA